MCACLVSGVCAASMERGSVCIKPCLGLGSCIGSAWENTDFPSIWRCSGGS